MDARRLLEVAAGVALAALMLGATARIGAMKTIAERLDLTGPHPAPLTVVAVLQEADCEGTVDFLRAFYQSPERYRLRALVPGDPDEVGAVRDRLAARVGPVPVERARARRIATLRSLGYDRTPFVVVLDGAGRVRHTAPGESFFTDPAATLEILGRIAATPVTPASTDVTP